MGKRRRPRIDEDQKDTTSVEGATPFQESQQQQEAVASRRSGRVLRMKQEPKLEDGSALSPPPVNTSALQFGDDMFSFLFGSE